MPKAEIVPINSTVAKQININSKVSKVVSINSKVSKIININSLVSNKQIDIPLDVIDWAGIANQTLTTATVIPGTDGLMTFFNDGGSGDVGSIESEQLKIVNASPQNGTNGTLFASHSTDLNTVRPDGTWKVAYRSRTPAGVLTNTMIPIIVGRLMTTGDLAFNSLPENEMTVMCDIVGTSENIYALRYQRRTDNAGIDFGSSVKAAGFQQTERQYEIEKTLTDYVWRIDVDGTPTIFTLSISLVEQPTSEFLHFGWVRSDTTISNPTGTIFVDNIAIT